MPMVICCASVLSVTVFAGKWSCFVLLTSPQHCACVVQSAPLPQPQALQRQQVAGNQMSNLGPQPQQQPGQPPRQMTQQQLEQVGRCCGPAQPRFEAR